MKEENELIRVKIMDSKSCKTIEDNELILAESLIDDKVELRLTFNNGLSDIKVEDNNYFNALLKLRNVLEQQNMIILCNGSAKNVYPSAMQLDMGVGRNAYVLTLGKQAETKDIVDIFDCIGGLEFVTIKEQNEFFTNWLDSLGK